MKLKKFPLSIICTTCIFLLFVSTAFAEVRLADVFGSGMVLQRDAKVPVWGWADPGERITLTFEGQSKKVVTDTEGRWMVELAPLKAGGPFSLTIKGNNELKLDDILVGDVWLCSGQSNMEWVMRSFPDAREEVPSIDKPNIRLYTVKRNWTQTPQDRFEGAWLPCNPEKVLNFSATGYYFGAELNKELNVPIGLINSSWGGIRIEPLTPEVGFHKVPALYAISEELKTKDPTTKLHQTTAAKTLDEYEKWLVEAKKNFSDKKRLDPPPAYPKELAPFPNNQQPTVLYNAMIHPMVPLAIKGVIWYQGESNRGDGMLYTEKMKALIEGLRTVFKNETLPFYQVQIAPYNYGNNPESLAELWEAQAAVEKVVPNTGMVVINDVGDLKNIHPAKKNIVGQRLARLALNRTYGKKDVVCDFPELKDMKIDDDRIVLDFANAKKLETRDGKTPDWFELAGPDSVFHKASATVDGTKIIVKSDAVKKPYMVRFAWSMLAEPNVQNEVGLPLGAFRAGEIPERGRFDELVSDGKNFKLLYSFNPLHPVLTDNNRKITYVSDKSKNVIGRIKRVGYFLLLKLKSGEEQFVFATMPPLDTDPVKLGVPTAGSGAFFQKEVKDVTVASNVSGVETGSFSEGCNVEFCANNYAAPNENKVPGASETAFDFGDKLMGSDSPGYGSMQLHNFAKKQTIFAFNGFQKGKNAEVGIGNCPRGGNPDWTFTNSAKDYESGQFLILIETE